MTIDASTLRKWKELCEAATPGPWEATFVFGSPDFPIAVVTADAKSDTIVGILQGDCSERPSDDIRFIAASREAVPALIAEVERLMKQLEKCKDIVTGARLELELAGNWKASDACNRHLKELEAIE